MVMSASDLVLNQLSEEQALRERRKELAELESRSPKVRRSLRTCNPACARSRVAT